MKTPTTHSVRSLFVRSLLAVATLATLSLVSSSSSSWAQQPQSAATPAAASAATPAATPNPALGAVPRSDATLYNDLGGLEVISKVVDDTLALALADDRIKDTFKNSDMKRLAKMLTEQFCELSGGPCKYSGDPMKEVHQGLALNNMHFNALVEDLQASMDKANIPSRTQNKLLALLAPMQRTVVTK